MSDTIVKGIKRTTSTPASRRVSANTTAKSRTLASKSSRPKPIAKRAVAEKAPAKKATKSKSSPLVKGKKKAVASPAKSTVQKSAKTKVEKAKSVKSKIAVSTKPSKPKAKISQVKGKTLATTGKKADVKPVKKSAAKAPVIVAKTTKTKLIPAKSVAKPKEVKVKPEIAVVPKIEPKKAISKPVLPPPVRKPVAPNSIAQKKPSPNVSAALHLFEKAHKDFVRGRFADARTLFQQLLEKHPTVVEVAARARTYLAITESRLNAETSLPKDADSLYDRGVIELNRGAYESARGLFELALKIDPNAAHIHYGLAATQAQLGQAEDALNALEKAFSLQAVLRFRVSQDQDFTPLYDLPEFEQLVSPN